MSLLDDERGRALAGAVGGDASHHVRFDRDGSDSYRIQIEPVAAGAGAVQRSHVMPVLPVGSRWADAVGWESHVVMPARLLPGLGAAIVGLEVVVPHASRGAYPVFAGAVVPEARVPAVLRRLALALDPDGRPSEAATYGVVESASRSPAEHTRPAASLLRSCARAFEQRERLLTRTLLLTEDEAIQTVSLLGTDFLVATAPGLRDRFSPEARLRLRLRRNPLPPG